MSIAEKITPEANEKLEEKYGIKIITEYVVEEPILVRSLMGGEIEFDIEQAMIVLLEESVVFLNSCWWRKDAPEDMKDHTAIHVNCNDVFAWGAADAETLTHKEIENLYDMWEKDPKWGAAIWCIKQRKQEPQRPVFDAIKADGVWDIETIVKEFDAEDEAEDATDAADNSADSVRE